MRRAILGDMAVQPEVTQTAHHSGALLDHLARRMRLRSEAVLAPLGLRPRHMVALTVLRDGGGSTQQALAATLAITPPWARFQNSAAARASTCWSI